VPSGGKRAVWLWSTGECRRHSTVVVVLTGGGVKRNHAVAVQNALFLPGTGNSLFHGSPAAGRSAILRIFGRGKKKEKFFPYQFFLLTILFMYFRDFNPITDRRKSLIKQ